jgi:uncharacterized membrane protein YfcA
VSSGIIATAAPYGVLAGAALIAGAMNAMAGGGSFISFPALLGAHIPPVNANATNTVALWPGQMASIVAFRAELRQGWRILAPVMLAGAVGGLAGALILLNTPQTTFKLLVPWLLLFATVIYAASKQINRWILSKFSGERKAAAGFPMPMFVSLTLVSIYIGYFGAGAGFLIITALTLFGIKNLNEVNALKALCTTFANGVAFVTFIVAGAVYWRECLTMMGMAIIGGYLGAAYSRKMNPGLLRGVVIGTGAALSAYYFYNFYVT